jgi:hypothetical protein
MLRLSFGPSPWAFAGRSFSCGGQIFRFREIASKGTLAGIISIQDANGADLLFFDFQTYARILNDGTTLVWRAIAEGTTKRIVFDSFSLLTLKEPADPVAAALELREKKLGIFPLPNCQHWECASALDAGVHPISLGHDWDRFEETLVLADHSAEPNDSYKNMHRAIFAFDWVRRSVQVFPQDWFNEGNYDFDYQWIARVARRNDGIICGEGVRLGSFELDATNRRITKWLSADEGRML